MRLRAGVVYALSLALALASPIAAQTINGRVTAEEGSAPLSGAVVWLLDDQGRTIRRVLTNREGLFTFSAAPGRAYRLRAEMIGHQTVESPSFEVGPGLALQSLRLPIQPVRLAAIDVDADRVCSFDARTAPAILQVRDEARKALVGAQITRDEKLYRFVITEHHRLLDLGSRRVSQETTEDRVWEARDPFHSLSPDEIERVGYVRVEGEQYDLFGPKTDIFLSPGFERTHCFSLRRERGRPDQIGLRFEVVDGREVPDIEGVLWLDQATAELRSLEFEYANLPDFFGWGDYTGSMEYTRLEGGAWIIREWWLRAPLREEGAIVKSIERLPDPD